MSSEHVRLDESTFEILSKYKNEILLLIFLVPLLTHLTRITSLRISHESEDPLGSSWNLVTINILQQMTMGLYFLYQMKTMILMIKPMLTETEADKYMLTKSLNRNLFSSYVHDCYNKHPKYCFWELLPTFWRIWSLLWNNVRFLIMWIQH